MYVCVALEMRVKSVHQLARPPILGLMSSINRFNIHTGIYTASYATEAEANFFQCDSRQHLLNRKIQAEYASSVQRLSQAEVSQGPLKMLTLSQIDH